MKKYLSFRHWEFLHVKTQTAFLVLAVVMTALVAWGIIYVSFLLVSRMNVAVTVEQIPPSVLKFDTEGFEKLNLTK